MSVKSRIFFSRFFSPYIWINSLVSSTSISTGSRQVSRSTGSSSSFTEKYRVPISFKISFAFSRRDFTCSFSVSSTGSFGFFLERAAKAGLPRSSPAPSKSPAAAFSSAARMRMRSLCSASSYRYGPPGALQKLLAWVISSFAWQRSSVMFFHNKFIHSEDFTDSKSVFL